MKENAQRYLSYLLRLWKTKSAGKVIWRASLESPGTGDRLGFASLQDLFEFLQGQTGWTDPGEEGPTATGRQEEGKGGDQLRFLGKDRAIK